MFLCNEQTHSDISKGRRRLGDAIKRVDERTLDVSGASEDIVTGSNEFFKKHPTARDAAEKIAVATTVAAPGGIILGPAIMHTVNKTKSNAMKKKIKETIKNKMQEFKNSFMGG
jgi:hypothetical protein